MLRLKRGALHKSTEYYRFYSHQIRNHQTSVNKIRHRLLRLTYSCACLHFGPKYVFVMLGEFRGQSSDLFFCRNVLELQFFRFSDVKLNFINPCPSRVIHEYITYSWRSLLLTWVTPPPPPPPSPMHSVTIWHPWGQCCKFYIIGSMKFNSNLKSYAFQLKSLSPSCAILRIIITFIFVPWP